MRDYPPPPPPRKIERPMGPVVEPPHDDHDHDHEHAAEAPITPQHEPEVRAKQAPDTVAEIGGRPGPEPTRYGDWENNGIASDF
ncbi:DUF1674 domain-containing protein [Zavarzinia sp. CC-PAN008]|uniref:DUF1674 domain-containing protein n=1 Tax=Zavarzinia sp. CC-PAN008 TaxID=3243332 RepID=UPI003F749570